MLQVGIEINNQHCKELDGRRDGRHDNLLSLRGGGDAVDYERTLVAPDCTRRVSGLM